MWLMAAEHIRAMRGELPRPTRVGAGSPIRGPAVARAARRRAAADSSRPPTPVAAVTRARAALRPVGAPTRS